MEGKEKTLRWVAEQTACICIHPYVFPCTVVAKSINESVYKVRKWMKELENDGYVKKDYEGGYDEYSGVIYCIHGYSLTEKGKETEYYKDKYKKELQWWTSRL